MANYKLIMIIVFIILLVGDKFIKNKKINKIIFCLLCIDLILFATFREFLLPPNEIGSDYYSYKSWFFEMNKIEKFQDCGFNALILLTKLIYPSYYLFLFFCNLIIFGCFYVFTKFISKEKYLLLFLFISIGLFEYSFNGLRQLIACSIFMASYKYLFDNRNFLKYCMFVFIASLFHLSAIFLVILYFWNDIKIHFNLKFIFSMLLVILLMNIGLIFNILNFVNSVFLFYISRYGNSDIYTMNYAMFVTGILLISLYLFEFKNCKYKKKDYMINMILLVIIGGILGPMHIIYARFTIYFSPIIIVFVMHLISECKFINKLKYKGILVSFFLLKFII